jgi:hypothetical protein
MLRGPGWLRGKEVRGAQGGPDTLDPPLASIERKARARRVWGLPATIDCVVQVLRAGKYTYTLHQCPPAGPPRVARP